MSIDKSDGSQTESSSETAGKRPSARRTAAESEPPSGEITAKFPKRVHARRPAAQDAREDAPSATTLDEPTRASTPPAPPAAGEGTLAKPASRSALRASARSARAGRSSSVPPPPSAVAPAAAASSGTTPVDASATAEHTDAASALGASELERATQAERLPLMAADAESRPAATQSASSRDAGSSAALAPQAEDAPARRSASRSTARPRHDVDGLVWHSDAAAPARLRSAEILSTPMASALARADFADDFGLDAGYEAKLRPWLEALCRRYLHVEVQGIHNIPASGRALLVANHSRSALWDGIILRTALRLHHEAGREPRWLVDDQQYHAPFLGTFVNRLGAVRACQENAERLLLREELVAVFPEGAKAAERRFEDRYRLQRFGRGGYVKLALRTGAPVIPVAIVAHDRDYASWLSRLSSASRLLSTPMLALRPGLPRLGRLGVPPIASHIQICIGEPVREIARQDALALRDDGLVHELNECVRGAVQQLVNASLQA